MTISHRVSRRWERNQHRGKAVRNHDAGWPRYWHPKRSGGRWFWGKIGSEPLGFQGERE